MAERMSVMLSWAMHAPVDEFHHGMNGGLRVDDDGYPISRDPEEMVRFDDFESLVHQGRGVDRDLSSHSPGRVIERILNGHRLELRFRVAEERTAGCSQHESFDIALARTVKTLVKCNVLAVYGEQARRSAREPRP